MKQDCDWKRWPSCSSSSSSSKLFNGEHERGERGTMRRLK
jgi:hypothetical protein